MDILQRMYGEGTTRNLLYLIINPLLAVPILKGTMRAFDMEIQCFEILIFTLKILS